VPLTDTAIRNAKPLAKPYKLVDGRGLFVDVRPSGGKTWRYRYRLHGRESIFTIGPYYADRHRAGHISLDQARRLRDEAREIVRKGLNPTQERNDERTSRSIGEANTFKAIAAVWLEEKRLEGRSAGYLDQIATYFERDVYPLIGAMPLRDIDAAALLAVVDAVKSRGARTAAHKVLGWIVGLFRFAQHRLLVDHDPTQHVRGAIRTPPVKHHRPLDRDELRYLQTALDTCHGSPVVVLATKLALLTFLRPHKELGQARWDEIDFDAAEWRVPAERMKMRRPHTVPLSRQALELLKQLHELTGHGPLLFPNHRDGRRALSNSAINRLLERLGFDGSRFPRFSAHGFRATASTHLNESDQPGDVIEAQMAHREPSSSRRSYNHALYFTQRRSLMQFWADYLDAMKRAPIFARNVEARSPGGVLGGLRRCTGDQKSEPAPRS
jgi:integrase